MPQAQPRDYNTAPSVDSSYSDSATSLRPPHLATTDGDANAGMRSDNRVRQTPFAELTARNVATSS